MRKQSISRRLQNSAQKRQPSQDKHANYVTCQQNFPLQLKGNMKRHLHPFAKQNVGSLLNYQSALNNKRTAYFDQNYLKSRNAQKCQENYINIKKNSKLSNPLIEKILTNNKLSNTKYENSVVPGEDLRSSKQHPQSIKTYKQERPGTGINYIMSAEDKNIYKKPQKRHIEEYHLPRRQFYGKKCNNSVYRQNQSNQMAQNFKESIVKQINEKMNPFDSIPFQNLLSGISATFAVVHASKTKKTISQNKSSSLQKKQIPKQLTQNKTKHESQNQFKTGLQLGYEQKKSKSIGCQKMGQMMGSQLHSQKANPTVNSRQKRDDWRKSTIVIG